MLSDKVFDSDSNNAMPLAGDLSPKRDALVYWCEVSYSTKPLPPGSRLSSNLEEASVTEDEGSFCLADLTTSKRALPFFPKTVPYVKKIPTMKSVKSTEESTTRIVPGAPRSSAVLENGDEDIADSKTPSLCPFCLRMGLRTCPSIL